MKVYIIHTGLYVYIYAHIKILKENISKYVCYNSYTRFLFPLGQ